MSSTHQSVTDEGEVYSSFWPPISHWAGSFENDASAGPAPQLVCSKLVPDVPLRQGDRTGGTGQPAKDGPSPHSPADRMASCGIDPNTLRCIDEMKTN